MAKDEAIRMLDSGAIGDASEDREDRWFAASLSGHASADHEGTAPGDTAARVTVNVVEVLAPAVSPEDEEKADETQDEVKEGDEAEPPKPRKAPKPAKRAKAKAKK